MATSTTPLCTALRKDGAPCGANALPGETHCAFHDPARNDISLSSLRALLTNIDRTVLSAYEWHDLNLEHGFHNVMSLPTNDRVRFSVSEVARLEVLRRLAALNRARYQEELISAKGLQAAQDALAERAASGRRPRRAAKNAADSSTQTPLFD